MEYLRVLLVGGFFLAVATVAVVYLKSYTEPPIRLQVSLDEGQDFRLGGGVRVWTTVENDDGSSQPVAVKADEAHYSRTDEVLLLTNLDVTLPEDEERPAMRVRGTHGRLDVSADRFQLTDGVTMTMQDLTVTMPTAEYDMATRRVTSPDPLQAHNDRMVLTGVGLVVQVDTQQMTVQDDVRVRFNVPKGDVSDYFSEGAP